MWELLRDEYLKISTFNLNVLVHNFCHVPHPWRPVCRIFEMLQYQQNEFVEAGKSQIESRNHGTTPSVVEISFDIPKNITNNDKMRFVYLWSTKSSTILISW